MKIPTVAEKPERTKLLVVDDIYTTDLRYLHEPRKRSILNVCEFIAILK